MPDQPEISVQHNPALSRYEATINGVLAVAEYELHGTTIVFTHTLVPSALQGQGVAGQIVRVALDDARTKGYQVVAQCSYVAAYIRRHPEYQALLAT